MPLAVLLRHRVSLPLTLLLSLACSLAVAATPSDDELIGPFSSWTNAKTAYGAKGDGTTDDTAALQQALNDLQTSGHSSNLYLPAGTYRVTGLTLRAKQGVSIVGADPATTSLVYAGPAGGTLLTIDGVAYSRFDRLTLDGGGKAGVSVDQSWNCSTGNFDTANQYADDVFQGSTTGLQGGYNGCGFAETSILRSRFLNLTTGILLGNFNALDVWIWYALFDHCGTGITNDPGAGNFHVFNSVFRSSSVADMNILNTGGFNIIGNFSSNSKAFWTTSAYRYPYAALTTLQGNSLVNVGNPAIDIYDQGPVLLLDNRVQSTDTTTPVVSTQNGTATGTDLITIGNTFPEAVATAVAVTGITRWTSLDDTTATLSLTEPTLPGTPVNMNRTVIEVAVGASATAIQAAVNSAATLSRAIVHLPEGTYNIDRTITIPANADLQLVGDGFFATRLNWTGSGTGPVIHITGPSRAILRDFTMDGATGAPNGILVDNVDQRNSRVYLQQTQLGQSVTNNLWADGLDYAFLDLRNVNHGGSANSIKVTGGPLAAANTPQTGRLDIFSGSSGDAPLTYDLSNGGQLLVRDSYYETNIATASAFAQISGTGAFTLHGGRVAAPASATIPAVNISNWHGNAALITTGIDGTVQVNGDGGGGNLLLLGLVDSTNANFASDISNPPDTFALLNSRVQTSTGMTTPIPNQGTATPALIRATLAQTRTEQPQIIADTPSGSSDVRLFRVWVRNAGIGLHVLGASSSCFQTLAAIALTIPAAGTSDTLHVASASGCPWTAQSNAAWLLITNGSSGTRDGSVYYTVQPNISAASRTGTITVSAQSVTVTQAGFVASATISPTSATVPATASTGSITVTANTSAFAWTASSNAAWVTITSGASGTGSGTVTYAVAANPGTSARTTTLTVAGQTFTLTQLGQASLSIATAYTAFTVPANSTAVQQRTVSLSSSAGAAAYTTSVTGTPLFVTASPSTGSTPATVTLSANPAGLTPGTYTNVVTFNATGNTAVAFTVSLTIQSAAAGTAKIAVYRASNSLILVDQNGDGVCCTGDLVGTIGQTGDIPLTGDWTGNGIPKFALYRPSTGLFLLDINNNGTFDGGTDKALTLAPQPGDLPVVGDWTGTGIDRVGVFRAGTGTWYLDVNGDGSFTGRAYLGQTGDVPLVGNWNGVGKSAKVGIYRPISTGGQPSNFFLVDTNGDGIYTSADGPLFFLGQPGDVPITGDWNGDGRTKAGIFRPLSGLFILDQNGNFAWDGPGTDRVQFFGPYLNGLTSSTSYQAGDIPITGNWAPSYAPPGANLPTTGTALTRTGIFRPSTGTFFLDNTGDGTFQGRGFLGQTGDTPLGVPIIANGTVSAVAIR